MSKSLWNIEDSKILNYISDKNDDYTEILEKSQSALIAWQEHHSHQAKDVLLYWIQTSPVVADSIFSQLTDELNTEKNLFENLELLEGCAKPRISQPSLLDELWNLFGATESSALAEQISHIIVILLPAFVKGDTFLPFERWWPALFAAMTKTKDRIQTSAALKVWLSCLSNCRNSNNSSSFREIRRVISQHSEDYFVLLEKHVAKANKLALQILGLSLDIIDGPVSCDTMSYDPSTPGIREAWARYISLIEILGIDTSIHQTEDSLADFAALMSTSSLIKSKWIISLINVGLCQSNTEGIRVLVMHLVMALSRDQLGHLAKDPEYVATVVFPKLLQTPNFVVLGERCLQAEHLKLFTENMLNAFIDEGMDSLRDFVFEFSKFLLEHAHCFEAPRVLVSNVMLNTLPENCLHARESVVLLAAAKATVMTYNSKALADLYYDLVKQVVRRAGPVEIESSRDESAVALLQQAQLELSESGELSRDSFGLLKKMSPDQLEALSYLFPKDGFTSPSTDLLEEYPFLQKLSLYGFPGFNKNILASTVDAELRNPRALHANDRKRLSHALSIAFDHIDSIEYEICEMTFSAFSEVETRFAALNCFKRSQPRSIDLEKMELLWSHIKDATLRIIDREFHLAFIDMLTEPGLIDENNPPTDICNEIVELSVLKRNLLVPLARGLLRFSSYPSPPSWVMLVMSRIFAFVSSKSYVIRMEEMVAHEFDVYESNWGEPESHARAIAAYYMLKHCQPGNHDSCDQVTEDMLQQADLQKSLTGSLDNIEAHTRVLYYQLLMYLQRGSSKELALEVLKQVRNSLEHEANPPVRVQGEWLIAVIGTDHYASSEQFADFVSESIERLRDDKSVPPRVLGSMIRISLLLYSSCVMRKSLDPNHLTEIGESLILRLIPLATSNKAVVRHRAISALYIMYQNKLTPAHLTKLVESIAEVNEGGIKHSSFQNEAYLWDVRDVRLGPVCGGVLSTVFDRRMPNTLLKSDFESVGDIEDLVGPCWSDEQVIKENRQKQPEFPDVVTYREKIVQEAVIAGSADDFSQQIQTKSGTFDIEYHARRTSLIVVASMCDKPVNLGAITRLSDALGASRLAIRDRATIEDPQFKSTSLTAEKWIPIDEVSEANLVNYLLERKAEGYHLVGIEQTDTSKQLKSTLQFPEKTLLIMGHERQGIPAEILAVLDSCVEIEQLGYVRSMNIQTATAVVVQAYNQNHGPGIQKVDYAKTS